MKCKLKINEFVKEGSVIVCVKCFRYDEGDNNESF